MPYMNVLHGDHQAFWRHMARRTGGRVIETPAGLLVDTGVDAAPFNQVHCAGTDDESAIAAAAAYFEPLGRPWRVVAETASPAPRHLPGDAPSFRSRSTRLLAVPVPKSSPTQPESATAAAARTIGDLREFIECAAASFGHAPALIERMVSAETLDDDAFLLHLVRVDGACAAASVPSNPIKP